MDHGICDAVYGEFENAHEWRWRCTTAESTSAATFLTPLLLIISPCDSLIDIVELTFMLSPNLSDQSPAMLPAETIVATKFTVPIPPYKTEWILASIVSAYPALNRYQSLFYLVNCK